MTLWLACIEDKDGMWNMDPIGGFSRQEVMQLVSEANPVIEEGEAIVIYECFEHMTFGSVENLRKALDAMHTVVLP